jgi:putative membrane protein
MFIDYIPLMLANMAGGLAVLAFYLFFGSDKPDGRAWGPAFGAVGIVALATGLHMSLTWPIPDLSKVIPDQPNLQFANVAFGQMSVLFGALFLANGLALAKGWSLWPLSVFAFVAGATALLVCVRIWGLGLTHNPTLTGIGFLLTGLGGLSAGLFLWLRRLLIIRTIAAAATIVAALIWAYIALDAYWIHLLRFSSPS